jgi:hypothetical protein
LIRSNRVAEQGHRRKLAAILSAHVVDYSRLMQDSDAATVFTLRKSVSRTVPSCVEFAAKNRHRPAARSTPNANGRVVQPSIDAKWQFLMHVAQESAQIINGTNRRAVLMIVPVMRIGEMSMHVCLRLVSMPVAMLRARGNREVMRMLVVRVMDMLVLVLSDFMRMLMLVAFGQVKKNTNRH